MIYAYLCKGRECVIVRRGEVRERERERKDLKAHTCKASIQP